MEGYADLRDLREAAKKETFVSLLIGNEAVVRKDAALQCEAEAEGSLPEELEGLSINDSYASLVSDLVQFLKQNNVELRQNPERFSHAKCYVFDNLAVVGSSNFTRPGLQEYRTECRPLPARRRKSSQTVV